MDKKYTLVADGAYGLYKIKYPVEIGVEVLEKYFEELKKDPCLIGPQIKEDFIKDLKDLLGYTPSLKNILKYNGVEAAVQYLATYLRPINTYLRNRVKDYEEGAYWTEEELVPGKTDPKGNWI